MRVTWRSLLRDTRALLARHGPWSYLEFAAYSVATTTLYALVAPDAFGAHLTRQEAAPAGAILADPLGFVVEAGYTLLFALVCLRIWEAETGQPEGAAGRRRRLARGGVALVLLNYLSGAVAYLGLLLFIVPGLLVMALTTVLVPAVVIEGRGWGALGRSLRMTRAHLLPLAAAWAVIGVPLVILGVMLGPDAAQEGGPIGPLWLSWILGDLVGALLSAASAALVMAAYLALLDGETGGGRTLPEVFR